MLTDQIYCKIYVLYLQMIMFDEWQKLFEKTLAGNAWTIEIDISDTFLKVLLRNSINTTTIKSLFISSIEVSLFTIPIFLHNLVCNK